MLILVLPSYLVLSQVIKRDKTKALHEVQQELNLLGHFTTNLLQSGDYEAAQTTIKEWSDNYSNIISITLETPNGFRIAELKNESAQGYQHSEMLVLKYGYRGNASLTLTKDISWIYSHMWENIFYMFAAWLSVGVFGIYLVRNLLFREHENIRLEYLSNQLGEANKHLDKEQMLLRSLIDSIPDLIFFKDNNSVYMGCNKAFELFVGKTEAEQIGKTDHDFFDADTASFFQSNDKMMMQSGMPRRNEEWVTYPDGQQVLLDTLKTPYYDSNGNTLGLIGVSRDITDIKKFQSQLEKMAYHDALTGLPNRRYLSERLQQAMAQADRSHTKLAICTIDLDGFKPINDRYGHDTGDKVLFEFADRLRNSLRAEDTVARWGGDEFSILFTNLNSTNECIELVERLQNLISLDINIQDNQFLLSASIGLTIYPDDNNNADTLMRHADQAMYEAKLSGKSQYHFFDPEQDKVLHDYYENRIRIEQAINQNELVLYYQPQIHLRQGAPYGVEALVRWNHPEHGILLPGKFLPYIENHQLNIELDWWVLEQAFAQLSQWMTQDIFFHISINLSAITFKQDDFVIKLKDLMSHHPDIFPEVISFELLETAALSNLTLVADKMNECQKLGFQFSLDDFGTGYSSLTYLSQLPADVLKIDQSFVRDMLMDARDAHIVESIVRLSSAFNRMVIAEGVEEILHGVKLIEMGCAYAQGYAIAKPMPAENIHDWLTRFKAPEEWLKIPRTQLKVLNGKDSIE